MSETKSCPMCGTDALADTERCQCGYTFASAKDGGAAIEWEPEMSAQGDPAEGWRIAGWLFSIFGIVGLGIGLYMSASVETYRSPDLAPYLPEAITNIDLLFKKGVTIAASLFAIGMGIFCMGVGSVVKAIGRA